MRGPRPPSEKWPTVQKAVGRWRQTSPKFHGEAIEVHSAQGQCFHSRVQAQPRTGGRLRRCCGRGEEVRGCDRKPRWRQCVCQGSNQSASGLRANGSVDNALSQKAVHEAEVAEGERRLAVLQAVVAQLAPRNFSRDRVTATDRCSCARTRRTAGQSRQGWQVDGQWTPVCREHPSHAQRPSGFGGLAQRPQLRASERNGVPRRWIGGSYRWFGWTGSDPVGVVGSRPRVPMDGQSRSVSSLIDDQEKRLCLGPGATTLAIQS